MSQKDTDAPWKKKNSQSYFGYKNHISLDVEYGFIRRYQVMDASVHDASVHDASVHDASVHDSQVLGALLDEQNEGEKVWADSVYRNESIECILQILQFLSHMHERAYRNHPLTAKHKEENREPSQLTAKVENVFVHWVNEMRGKLMRSIHKHSVKATIEVVD